MAIPKDTGTNNCILLSSTKNLGEAASDKHLTHKPSDEIKNINALSQCSDTFSEPIVDDTRNSGQSDDNKDTFPEGNYIPDQCSATHSEPSEQKMDENGGHNTFLLGNTSHEEPESESNCDAGDSIKSKVRMGNTAPDKDNTKDWKEIIVTPENNDLIPSFENRKSFKSCNDTEISDKPDDELVPVDTSRNKEFYESNTKMSVLVRDESTLNNDSSVTENPEEDTSDKDQTCVQDTSENDQSLSQDTVSILEHNIGQSWRHMKECVILGSNGPYLAGKMSCIQFAILLPNGPYLLAQMTCIQFAILLPNGPYLLAQMTCIEFAILLPNGTYLAGKMTCIQFAIQLPNGPYVLAKMKPAFRVLVVKNNLNGIRSSCLPKSDQLKCGEAILGNLPMLLCNQIPVYAAVADNHGNGDQPQNNTEELVISAHEAPLLVYNPPQLGAVAVHEGPLQHPAQNDTGMLAISDHESPPLLQNPPQHVAVAVHEGPLQQPAQNDDGVLAISEHEPYVHPHNQQQQPAVNEAVVLHEGQI